MTSISQTPSSPLRRNLSPVSMTNEDHDYVSDGDGATSRGTSTYGPSGTNSAFLSQNSTVIGGKRVRGPSETSSWAPSDVDEMDGMTSSETPFTMVKKNMVGSPSNRMAKEASSPDGRTYHNASLGIFHRTPATVNELTPENSASKTSEVLPVADSGSASSPHAQRFGAPSETRVSPVARVEIDRSSPTGLSSSTSSTLHTRNGSDQCSPRLVPGTPTRTSPDAFKTISVSEISSGIGPTLSRLNSSRLLSSDLSARSQEMDVLSTEITVEDVSPKRPSSAQLMFDCKYRHL